MPTVPKSTTKQERYLLARSPLAQRPTQKEIALLLGETRDDLRRLANYKEQFVVRRTEETGKKVKKIRELKYPVGRLRVAHEKLKFQLNKIQQPSYLFSPRKGKNQRDNAALHLDQDQFLTLDLKKFYPSTTADMVLHWMQDELKMYPDVARLLTRLITIDDAVSFGSPLTPVLCTLVHRKMFDQIADACARRRLRYSVWVDDITISGKFVPGEFLLEVRSIVRNYGLKTHKIEFRTGNRPVFVTGVGIVGKNLTTTQCLNREIKELFELYHLAETIEEKEDCSQKLLSKLGTVKFISGSNSLRGQKTAGQMNTIRQELAAFRKIKQPKRVQIVDAVFDQGSPPPF